MMGETKNTKVLKGQELHYYSTANLLP